jgi:hypothetical protein
VDTVLRRLPAMLTRTVRNTQHIANIQLRSNENLKYKVMVTGKYCVLCSEFPGAVNKARNAGNAPLRGPSSMAVANPARRTRCRPATSCAPGRTGRPVLRAEVLDTFFDAPHTPAPTAPTAERSTELNEEEELLSSQQ